MSTYELVVTHIGHRFYPQAHENRRNKVFEKLGDSILVITSNPTSVMSNDVEYPYRPNSDLYYLTGFEEEESAAIFFIDKETKESKYYLFVRPRDKEKETWTGKRYGIEGAKKYFNPTEAFTNDKFLEVLEEELKTHSELIFNFGVDAERDNEIIQLVNKVRPSKWKEGMGINNMKDISEFLHPMRLIKDEHELSLIRKACEISAEAHIEAMKAVKPGMWEYQLQSIIEHYFIMHGAKRPGYPSIVGSGANATILHYTENNHQVKDGDLILIDAGAEYSYYNADITRTFPANGEFSNPQKELYELVYKAQQEAFKAIKPGSSLVEIHDIATKTLVEGMIELGLLEGNIDKILEEETYKEYYMHGTGHWLGIDVHDAGRKKLPNGEPVKLEPGMVFTVEPGIYVSPDSEAPEKYKGIGIRIEDDVVVTKDGYEILTTKVPSQIDQVEELIGKK